MPFNNPLPASLAEECQKCGRILHSFIDPREAFGPEKVIPPSILANAKGLAILTVAKVGFVGSIRFGSGLLVARRPDNSWSAPSAIGTFGAGFGGQVGGEITDFVFILNDADAVRTFAQAGSVTLGGNVSVAAGPIGRNAEAAGAASLRSVAGIFSYSKTKGLFAGVSLEGSAIVERRDANEKLYGTRHRARELLMGAVEPPLEAGALMTILNSAAFGGGPAAAAFGETPATQTSDQQRFGQSESGVFGNGRPPVATHAAAAAAAATPAVPAAFQSAYAPEKPAAFSTPAAAPASAGAAGLAAGAAADAPPINATPNPSRKAPPPPKPTAPKPSLEKRVEAIAMYTFDADQEGDLGFVKGDVITVIKQTDNATDWWTGRIGDRQGVFPSNYIKMRE